MVWGSLAATVVALLEIRFDETTNAALYSVRCHTAKKKKKKADKNNQKHIHRLKFNMTYSHFSFRISFVKHLNSEIPFGTLKVLFYTH